MADAENTGLGDARTIECLTALQSGLGQLAEHMQTFARDIDRQRRQLDDLAAHVLALDALMGVVLAQVPTAEADVRAAVGRKSKEVLGDDEANPFVESVALDILRRGGN